MSRISRNAPCPCESGRKYKRCCGAARTETDPRALSRSGAAVGNRIQEWAYANHRDEMEAALDELVGDPRGMVFGDADTQLAATWQLNHRELPGGGTPAQRYARLARLTDSERAIACRIASAQLALLRVLSTEPGRAIEVEDVTRGSARVRVVSHQVSSYVQSNDMFVGHLMPGPPSASLWGHITILDRRGGRELIDLLEERIALLGLDPCAEHVLGAAMASAALEVTRMLMPALRSASRRPWRRGRALRSAAA